MTHNAMSARAKSGAAGGVAASGGEAAIGRANLPERSEGRLSDR
jgi:hypothetical protein